MPGPGPQSRARQKFALILSPIPHIRASQRHSASMPSESGQFKVTAESRLPIMVSWAERVVETKRTGRHSALMPNEPLRVTPSMTGHWFH